MSNDSHGGYYLPNPSHWPLVGCLGLFCLAFGAATWLHGHGFSPWLTAAGALIMIYMMFGWFGTVIRESQAGLYDDQVDRTFRWSMGWFIFSEVCFFGAFFGALFYARLVTVPSLSGAYDSVMTHLILWPNFEAHWPLLNPPDSSQYQPIKEAMHAWGLPALNTLILLTSGATITWAHWGLIKNKRCSLMLGMILTVLLGIAFLLCQFYEYGMAYSEHGLTLQSGIFGTLFFLLTGFHGMHVTVGTLMLIVITFRCKKGHFTKNHHFAFEAVAWYWHFVDIVWLLLFILVYWL